MSDKMNYLLTTVQDLADYQNYIVGSSAEALRVSQNRVNKDLITLNRLLVTYTSEAHLLLAKALNNLPLSSIEAHYIPDVLESNSASAHVSNTPPLPHQNVGFNKSQISQRLDGISDRDAELNRVNYNKQMCLSKIRKLTRLKAAIDNALAFA
jgi:hypothetical protein